METIHRSMGNVPLPDVRVCQHLAMMIDNDQWPSRDAKSCANCTGLLCPSCEDKAVHCSGSTCVGLICLECQATARKRDRDTTGPSRFADYLCSPCCAKQDAARKVLGIAVTDEMCADIFSAEGFADALGHWPDESWLDDIVAKLEEAIEKAKEAL